MAKRVRITWYRGAPGSLRRHRQTLKALGFTKLNSTVEHELTPSIAGMIHQVSYMVRVEEIHE